MTVLSIQSHVAVGHAGNAAAVFPIERMGLEVWPVFTTLLSHHKAHPHWRGYTPEAAQLEEIIAGIEASGALSRCRAVLVGYLAHIDQVRVVAATLGKVRGASRDALFLLDPVLGEKATGLYVEPGIAEAVRERLVPTADIVTPNAFELEYLSGVEAASLEDALRAADRLRVRGPSVVICSSCPGAGEHEIATLAVTEDGAWRVLTPRLASRVFGTGDLLAAIFLAQYLSHGSIEGALGHAVSAVYGVLQATLAHAADELALIAAQDEIVAPSALFAPERLR